MCHCTILHVYIGLLQITTTLWKHLYQTSYAGKVIQRLQLRCSLLFVHEWKLYQKQSSTMSKVRMTIGFFWLGHIFDNFWQDRILIIQPFSIIIQLEITENNVVELLLVKHQPNDKQHINYEFPITGSINQFNFVRWSAWYKAIISDLPKAKIVMYVEKRVLSDTP